MNWYTSALNDFHCIHLCEVCHMFLSIILVWYIIIALLCYVWRSSCTFWTWGTGNISLFTELQTSLWSSRFSLLWAICTTSTWYSSNYLLYMIRIYFMSVYFLRMDFWSSCVCQKIGQYCHKFIWRHWKSEYCSDQYTYVTRVDCCHFYQVQ